MKFEGHFTLMLLLATSWARRVVAEQQEWEQCESEECYKKKLKVDLEEGEAYLKHLGIEEEMDVANYFEDLKTARVRIAVTGQSGTGKSTLVNSLRNLLPESEGAAKVDVAECTKEPTKYILPTDQNMEFWDLPGANTQTYNRSVYLDKIQIDRYDYFLICSRGRFTDDDAWLAKEINKKRKRFTFVRTMINVDIQNDREDYPQTHSEQKVIKRVHKDCLENLQKAHVEARHVFLISGRLKHSHQWDYSKMLESIQDGLSDMKRHKFVLSMSATSIQLIKKKKVPTATLR